MKTAQTGLVNFIRISFLGLLNITAGIKIRAGFLERCVGVTIFNPKFVYVFCLEGTETRFFKVTRGSFVGLLNITMGI